MLPFVCCLLCCLLPLLLFCLTPLPCSRLSLGRSGSVEPAGPGIQVASLGRLCLVLVLGVGCLSCSWAGAVPLAASLAVEGQQQASLSLLHRGVVTWVEGFVEALASSVGWACCSVPCAVQLGACLLSRGPLLDWLVGSLLAFLLLVSSCFVVRFFSWGSAGVWGRGACLWCLSRRLSSLPCVCSLLFCLLLLSLLLSHPSSLFPAVHGSVWLR